jgi:murein DD-endopeptidase MepM/ murein hydrolase activator NlpD
MGRSMAESARETTGGVVRLALVCGAGVLLILSAALAIVSLTGARIPILGGGATVGPAPPPPPAPGLLLSATSVPQGGAFSVRLRSAALAAASISFRDHEYSMIESGDQWFAVIGAGQNVGSEEMVPVGDYPASIHYQFTGSSEVFSTRVPISVTQTDFQVDAIDPASIDVGLLTPELAASESAQLQQAYGAFTPQQLWQGMFLPPVNGTITTVFGARRSYDNGPATGSHSGVDLGVPLGTPVGASAAGRVAWTGSLPDRGNGVIIDHGLGVFSGYFHLSRVMAQQGQLVSTGDVIGLAGSTGLSTGPHVHWEVAINGVNVDALQFSRLSLP